MIWTGYERIAGYLPRKHPRGGRGNLVQALAGLYGVGSSCTGGQRDVCERRRWREKRAKRSGSGQNLSRRQRGAQILGTATDVRPYGEGAVRKIATARGALAMTVVCGHYAFTSSQYSQ